MVHVMSKSPLSTVKERFGDDPKKAKQKLVEAVKKAAGKDLWLERVSEQKGLEHVSNKKLLHLERVFEAVSKKVGSRDQLIEAIVGLEGRNEDEGYKARLTKQSTPNLWDRYRAVQSRAAGTPAED
jgi:hypothetical protein